MNEVVLIVDQYRLREKMAVQGRKQNPIHEAQAMSQIVNAFGRNPERLAIVDTIDKEGIAAYSQAQYKLELMNGNRLAEINGFISKKKEEMETVPPRELVVVTDDPTFHFLLNSVHKRGQTALKVWVPGKEVPYPYNEQKYNARLLSEVLPELRVPRVDIRIDFENLYPGLKQRGLNLKAKGLVKAIEAAVADLGDITYKVAYADWEILLREDRRSWQRELTAVGVETRFLINERGKNTADMKIADDVRTLVERDQNTPDAAEIVVLVTTDRDFQTVIETARRRGQRVVLLGIRGGLSRHLREVVKETDIRYIDDYLQIDQKLEKALAKGDDTYRPNPADDHADLLVHIAVWLAQQSARGWYYAPLEQLQEVADADALQAAVKQGLLIRQRRQSDQGVQETVALNRKHPLTATAEHLARWAPKRVAYCLQEKGMPYVDSNFLAKGMLLDNTLKRLGAGQNRYEAEGWLDLLAQAGALASQRKEHPTTRGKTVTTWWLPETSQETLNDKPLVPEKIVEPEADVQTDSEHTLEKPTVEPPPEVTESSRSTSSRGAWRRQKLDSWLQTAS